MEKAVEVGQSRYGWTNSATTIGVQASAEGDLTSIVAGDMAGRGRTPVQHRKDFSEPGGGFDMDAQRKGGTTGCPPDFWLMVLGAEMLVPVIHEGP